MLSISVACGIIIWINVMYAQIIVASAERNVLYAFNLNLMFVPCILDVVEITNTMHRFASLLYSVCWPTCFGSSLSSSRSL
jgi:hypothetical protein